MEAWIEINVETAADAETRLVASCVEAWIEISGAIYIDWVSNVASCVEAWIEIFETLSKRKSVLVASCVEAWIEIRITLPKHLIPILSPPAWRRGLKSVPETSAFKPNAVASCVEAWIEIEGSDEKYLRALSRLLRGGVD